MAGAVIYEPKGRAREYAELAVNLYETCPHGCTYCYVPGAMHKKACDFHAPARARKDILGRLALDARKMRGDPRQVLMCFACDPYPMKYESAADSVTPQALGLLKDYGIGVAILTKGHTFSASLDLPLLQRMNCKFGVTLTSLKLERAAGWEPGSGPPANRIAVLKKAKAMGIPTWASMEPVMDVEESLLAIEAAAPHCDEFKLGKLNHHSELERQVDWADYLRRATDLCTKHQVPYHVKADLAKVAV